MTWALCLNCGEVKFGALCPCPKCNQASTGDTGLDIAFSDHRMGKESLEELGAVIAALHEVSGDDQLCYWTFIHYVSENHPSILSVELDGDGRAKCDELLGRVKLPAVEIRPSPREQWIASREANRGRRWWQFWRRRPR
jgi:hypothetical protein